MKKMWKSLFGICVAVGFISQSYAEPAPTKQQMMIEDCHVEGIRSQVRCGKLTVPENYNKPTDATLDVNFVVLPAHDNSKNNTPMMFLAGGPGQAAAQMASGILRMFSEVRKTRDIILVDQRGTGQSNGLQCNNFEDYDLYEDITDDMSSQDILDCLADFNVDLSHYNTTNAIRDFDALRDALSIEKIALYGGSYGTRAALVYMNMFPQHIESVVLDSVGPVEIQIGLFGQTGARSYQLLLENCQLDEACHQAFPNLDEEFQALIERVEAEPIRATVMHPTLGSPTEFVISRTKLISTLRLQLYFMQGRQFVPYVIHQAYLGNYLPLAGLVAQSGGDESGQIHAGLLFNILCSEDYPLVKQNQWQADADNNFGRNEAQKNWHLACGVWPTYEVEREYFKPVTADIPTLIMSGKLDPVTPPSYGDITDKTLPNSRHIVVKNASHIVVSSPCAIDLVNEFLTNKDPQAIDDTCLVEIEDERFITHVNGSN